MQRHLEDAHAHAHVPCDGAETLDIGTWLWPSQHQSGRIGSFILILILTILSSAKLS